MGQFCHRWKLDSAAPLSPVSSVYSKQGRVVREGMFWVFEHPQNFKQKFDKQMFKTVVFDKNCSQGIFLQG